MEEATNCCTAVAARHKEELGPNDFTDGGGSKIDIIEQNLTKGGMGNLSVFKQAIVFELELMSWNVYRSRDCKQGGGGREEWFIIIRCVS